MGRKIPGKKHHGVKDPEKQRARRLAELAPKINAPPEDCDAQDIPKSLQRLIQLKNAAKNGAFALKKRKKKKGPKLIRLGAEQQGVKLPHPKAKPEKVVPIFNQEPGETKHQFWNRVNRETHAFIKETEFETKFNVNVKRSEDTGEIVGVVRKPKDELDQLEKLRSKSKNIKKKKKVSEGDTEPKSKSQKRREKLLKKKERKHQDDIDEFKTFKDKVEFGEVAHAPPELKVLQKNVDKKADKPKNKNLLLNSILNENKPPNIEKSKTINKSGKRKNLPFGERRQLEKQQSDVIAAYRLLKAKKLGESG